MLVELLPAHAEPKGLLALMLLHDSRRETRLDGSGDIVLLEDQDRTRWDRAQIDEGAARRRSRAAAPEAVRRARMRCRRRSRRFTRRRPPPPTRIGGRLPPCTAVLARVHPTPVVELNRAVAVAMSDGIERGLALVNDLDQRGELDGYHLLPVAQAELLRRLGRHPEAAEAYRRASGAGEQRGRAEASGKAAAGDRALAQDRVPCPALAPEDSA